MNENQKRLHEANDLTETSSLLYEGIDGKDTKTKEKQLKSAFIKKISNHLNQMMERSGAITERLCNMEAKVKEKLTDTSVADTKLVVQKFLTETSVKSNERQNFGEKKASFIMEIGQKIDTILQKEEQKLRKILDIRRQLASKNIPEKDESKIFIHEEELS